MSRMCWANAGHRWTVGSLGSCPQWECCPHTAILHNQKVKSGNVRRGMACHAGFTAHLVDLHAQGFFEPLPLCDQQAGCDNLCLGWRDLLFTVWSHALHQLPGHCLTEVSGSHSTRWPQFVLWISFWSKEMEGKSQMLLSCVQRGLREMISLKSSSKF